jgi:single-strand DNA-binding protein
MKGDLLKMTNHITILGRVTKQVDVRYTPSQKVVCSFTLAVDRPFLNQEGKREADFIPVVVWGKAAELCGNSLAKGHRILVEGRLQIRSYDGKDGNRHWVTEVIANSVEFIERKSDAKNANIGKEVPFDEDVPF